MTTKTKTKATRKIPCVAKKQPVTAAKPSKGQTKESPFKVAGFQINGMACRGGKDSAMRYCSVDFYDFKTRKHRLYCCCSVDDQGEAAAKYIADACNAAWAANMKNGAK